LAHRGFLERLGFTYDEHAPDLLVNFYLNIVDKQEIRSTHLVDARKNALVWQGLAEGRLKDESLRNPGPAIDAVVAEIFRNFPNPPSD
jgi:hypothetical protein